ncbi:MAG: 2OG-Fe(II) oxygenase [Sideroxydans sp.]|nr:2OG-Fe(II) oxygenase [Sideroxydans sp.]
MDIDKIADALEQTGYIVLKDALEARLLQGLLSRCQDDGTGRFVASHVGRGTAKQKIETLRGDVISWIEPGDATDTAFLDRMETLRRELNSRLFLGMFDYESHYAIYSSGFGYGKHSDVLQGKKNRILTTVLYLNEDWQPEHGGELVVYDPAGETEILRVQPTFGTMIIFLSESYPHEVLISNTTRRSIAGWFRVSGS